MVKTNKASYFIYDIICYLYSYYIINQIFVVFAHIFTKKTYY